MDSRQDVRGRRIVCRPVARRTAAVALLTALWSSWSALPVGAAEPTATPPAGSEEILTPAPATPVQTPAAAATPTTPSAKPTAASAKDSDEFEVLIIQALDQPTDLNVQDVPIREAIDQLGANTGIPIKLVPGVLSLLPYGSQTKLSATIQKQPLRESLIALLRPLGLKFAPAKRELLIYPTPPLARIGRRATWEELGVLQKLSTQPMTPELFNTLQFQFQDVGGDARAGQELAKAVESVGAGPASEVLEYACDRLGWTWHPEGKVIAVLTKTKQIERQLESRVTLRYVQVSLTEALTDLGNRAGVLVHFDPGVLNELPAQMTERFSLSMENATVRQAFEVVAGETGLRCVVVPDGVRITLSAGPTATAPAGSAATSAQVDAVVQAAARRATNPIVGQIMFPLADGSSFAFWIRSDDLPPEVNAMREAKIARTVNQIRQKLHSEQPQD